MDGWMAGEREKHQVYIGLILMYKKPLPRVTEKNQPDPPHTYTPFPRERERERGE
jgi:hypothetical protein